MNEVFVADVFVVAGVKLAAHVLLQFCRQYQSKFCEEF